MLKLTNGIAEREENPMTFTPGQNGNSGGCAVGGRNKQTLAAEAALFEHAQELVEDLVARAKRGEPAAMRLAMDRILPTGRGRPLPIELPPVRSTEDAQVAAGVIMDALRQGALSAREAADLINVVTALTRLTGTIEIVKKAARREVAKAAQTLGIDHFYPGPPVTNDYTRLMAEMNADADADEDAAETDEDELPRHPDEYRSTPEDMEAYAAGAARSDDALPAGNESLQIVADSERRMG